MAFLRLSCNDFWMLMDNLLRNPVERVRCVWHLEMSVFLTCFWILVPNYLFKSQYSNTKRVSRAHGLTVPHLQHESAMNSHKCTCSVTYTFYSPWQSHDQVDKPTNLESPYRYAARYCCLVVTQLNHFVCIADVIVQSQGVQIFACIYKKLQMSWQPHHSLAQSSA